METGSRDTREDILQAALELFSQKGFSGVSIRDICRVVGIRESTVYYHFTNKEGIFLALLAEFEALARALQNAFNAELSTVSRVGRRDFIDVGLAFLNGYLLDGKVVRFIRMLMIEQHVSAQGGGLYHRLLFQAPLAQHEAVFHALMRMDCFRQGDARYMAEEYYAPIFLIFQSLLCCGAVSPQEREEASARAAAHLKDFYDRYSLEGAEGDTDEDL
jgi:AcrR family transcriptional regulator